MIKNLFGRKKANVAPPAEQKNIVQLEAELRQLAENFIGSDVIEVINAGVLIKIPSVKWIYPGHGDYMAHAIIPNASERTATEIVNDGQFVNDFLHNRRDINGFFGFFIARIEGNYVLMSLNGEKLFASVKESKLDDYDTLVLIKQCNRLFPKFNKETFAIEFKHIEVFGDVFNKLKSKLCANYIRLSREEIALTKLDIPTYTQSSIKIEDSVDSYNIFKMANVIEKISYDLDSITASQAKEALGKGIHTIEMIKDMLQISDQPVHFSKTIENIEKLLEQLYKIAAVHSGYALAKYS